MTDGLIDPRLTSPLHRLLRLTPGRVPRWVPDVLTFALLGLTTAATVATANLAAAFGSLYPVSTIVLGVSAGATLERKLVEPARIAERKARRGVPLADPMQETA